MILNPKSYYQQLEKEVIPCPVCQSKNSSVLFKTDRYGMDIQTVQCFRCGLVYVNPRPVEREINDFYSKYYREFYESVDVPDQHYIDSGTFKDRANFVVNSLERYLSRAESFLDVGCAEGTLLNAIEKGYPNMATCGIEPSPGFGGFASDTIKGEVFIGTFEDFKRKRPESKFDIITTCHVLEHIPSPKSFLELIRTLMHDQSVLYIEVPNILDKRVNGIGAIHLAHLLYFDPESLKNLIVTSGFEIIETLTEKLPASTPAMAIICQKMDKCENLIYSTSKNLENKHAALLARITPESLKPVRKVSRNGILKKVLQKIRKL